MTKTINISDEAYEKFLKQSAKKTIELGKNVSIADVVDEIVGIVNTKK